MVKNSFVDFALARENRKARSEGDAVKYFVTLEVSVRTCHPLENFDC